MALGRLSRRSHLLAAFGLVAVFFQTDVTAKPRSAIVKSSRRQKNRYLQVLVRDINGKALPNAEVIVLDAVLKTPLSGQKFKVNKQGKSMILVRTHPQVALMAAAPGKESQTLPVYWGKEYTFTLRQPRQKLPALTPKAERPITIIPAPPIKKTRAVSVVAEDLDGKRLRDAEVAVLEAESKKIVLRKLLINGLGSFEIEKDPGKRLVMAAIAPGRLSSVKDLGEQNNYIFKLRRRLQEGRIQIVVRDSDEQVVKGAAVRLNGGTIQLAAGKTDPKGELDLKFQYEEDARLNMEIRHPDYRHLKQDVRLKVQTTFSLQLKPLMKSYVFSVVVEDENGGRVRDAEVSIIEAGTQKHLANKLLLNGLGTIEVQTRPKSELKAVVKAAGRERLVQKFGREKNIVFKLKRLSETGRLFVTLVDERGRGIRNAHVLLTDGTRAIFISKTNVRGQAAIKFEYQEDSALRLTLQHKEYKQQQVVVDRAAIDRRTLEVKLIPLKMTYNLSVTVAGEAGENLPDARVAVRQLGTKRVLHEESLRRGRGNIKVEAASDSKLEIVASADRREPVTREVNGSGDYRFKLRWRVERGRTSVDVTDDTGKPLARALVALTDSGKRIKAIQTDAKGRADLSFLYTGASQLEVGVKHKNFLPAAGVLRPDTGSVTIRLKPLEKTYLISLVVESEKGERLKDAEVKALDTEHEKLLARKLFQLGIGSVELKAAPDANIELIASAPGHESGSLKLGKSKSYVFVLKRRMLKGKVAVSLKSSNGAKISNASAIISEAGRELVRGTSDVKGWTQLTFQYSDPSLTTLEVIHGGYQTRKLPLRPGRDQSVDVVLLPRRPKVKSAFLTVIVLSKTFTASPKTYARVRSGVEKILSDCVKHRGLWAHIGMVSLGDGRTRELLSMSSGVDGKKVKQVKGRLSDLYSQAGTLSWRDLNSLAGYLDKTGKVGASGCDILVLAPKNLSMDGELSLYEAGGEPVLEAFRKKNLRLRLVEIGVLNDVTRAYRELCEGTQGFYKTLLVNDSLPKAISDLQFHFPSPPPPN